MALPASNPGSFQEDDSIQKWFLSTLTPAYGKLRFWSLSFLMLIVVCLVTVGIRKHAPAWSWLVSAFPAGDWGKQYEWLGVGSVWWQVDAPGSICIE
jgi:hypothetical protein